MNTAQLFEWGQFAPVYALVGVAVLIILADAFLPRLPKCVYPVTGALTALVTAFFMYCSEEGAGLGFTICLAIALSLFLAYDYRKVMCDSIAGGDNEEGTGEFNALCLIAGAGACGLAIMADLQKCDLVTLFVCLETLTLSSYALAGYFRRNRGSIEAGVKYLVLGAMSTGLLVFGAAWYFGTTGQFEISTINYSNALSSGVYYPGFMVALCLLLTGAFFKVGAAPMHVWIPDVYQGAPTPASAFLAAASKAAGFVVLILLLYPLIQLKSAFEPTWNIVFEALIFVTAATLLIGNLGAIGQSNVKRLLGYSSVGQAGFILVFFLGSTDPNDPDLVPTYLLAYTLATVPAFYAAAMVRTQRGSEEISAFRGLAKTNPRTAFLITVLFASLAGVPLTYGFIAKFQSFKVLVKVMVDSFTGHAADAACTSTCCCSCGNCALLALLVIMVVCAAAGFYYYFKVLRAMYLDKPREYDKPLSVPGVTVAVLVISVLALIGLGTWPLLTGSLL